MEEKIKQFLVSVDTESVAIEFYSMCLFAMICFENNDFEMIGYMDGVFYGDMISKGYGFSNSESKFSPSVVEFGEFVEFLNADIQKMKNGELSKEEVRVRIWEYFQKYIADVKH